MKDQKILNALSYFSLFFAPLIVPIAIWIFSATESTKHHAKVALLTHILPTIGAIVSVFIVGVVGFSTNSSNVTGFIGLGLIVSIGIMIVVLAIFNIVRGIQALVAKDDDPLFNSID
ncbi:DUF4870 domain-containing protein [Listeria grandensis]|uniref:DUF4870 domain-containing protein n=1 Tax=Listeria grandensis FSL F6-0971 TaxID=1265819 RepID=W7B892_9LIST|nr:DUF4870 domain-containing protein [Listeria grandensis]EUJ23479.1 hypothetical protein PGRAN_08339 [Listeria grandensis FSL F6-0971]MBC1475925.1 DUF4870 domain-containing protein [Listeria grandensis]MBC6314438.1 DUF4870 domain-containing protein [Listeria grandensis]